MPRSFFRASTLAASLSAISMTALKPGRFLDAAQRAFAQIDSLEQQHMATSDQLAQLTTSVNDLLGNVTKLSDAITTETQQQTELARQQTAALETLRGQLAGGADDGTIQATIDQVQQANTAIVDSTGRIQSIVPDAQAAVKTATSVSTDVSNAVESSAATDTSTTVPATEAPPSESQFAEATS